MTNSTTATALAILGFMALFVGQGVVAPAGAEPQVGVVSPTKNPVIGQPTVRITVQADLRIEDIRTLDQPVRAADGTTSVALQVTVGNRGSGTAVPAKIAVFATVLPGSRAVQVPYGIPGQRDQDYGWTGSLAAGGSQQLTGRLVLAPLFTGKRLRLYALVDSIHGEEFGDPAGRVRESNEGNNESRSIRLDIPGQVSSLNEVDTSAMVKGAVNRPVAPLVPGNRSLPKTPPSSAPEDWSMTLNRLLVWRAAESSGDDPQLYPIVFRARFGDPDSVRTYFTVGPIKLGTDLHNGSIVPINAVPFRFGNVRRIKNHEFNAGDYPELLGMVVLAFEDNGTTDSELRGAVQRLSSLLTQELRGLVGRWDIVGGPPAMQRSLNRLMERIEPSAGEAVRIVIESGFDPDLPAGVQVLTFLAIDPDDPPAFITRTLRGTATRILDPAFMSWTSREQGPVELRSDGRHWKLEMRVQPQRFYGPGDL